MEWFVDASPSLARRCSALIVIVVIFMGGLTGCLVRRREKISVGAASAPIWKVASLQDLLNKIKDYQNAIQTLQLTATLEPSVSSLAKGEIVHYRDIKTFILIRKPDLIRMIGLYPVFQNTAFDMASNGKTFRLYIPVKNRFIIGENREEHPSKPGLENLRPQHILEALLFKGPEPGREQAVLETLTQGNVSYYVVHIIRTAANEPPVLSRNIWFERRGLNIVRMEMFDDNGDVVTDVHYSNYADFSGILYPKRIAVERPKDFYGVTLNITSLQLNLPLPDEKFRLQQPPGTQLVKVGRERSLKKATHVG